MTSLKVGKDSAKVRESLHTKEREGIISRKIDGKRIKERNSEIISNIATAKSKSSKRTVVANEGMARLLQTDMMLSIAKVLSLQCKYENKH